MFAPVGKKKVLLQIRLAKASGVSDPLTALGLREKLSKSVSSVGGTTARSTSQSPDRRKLRTAGDRIREEAPTISKPALIKLLRAKNDDGVVVRRIMESTSKYRPDRDPILLKVFESKDIDYASFRKSLNTTLGLTFTDNEYEHVVHIFDMTKTGKIDGFQFMLIFIKLNSIRKERDAKEAKKKQEELLRNKEFEDERKRLEAEKKMEFDANLDYSEQARASALNKLQEAAKKFDPCHPSAPKLDGLTAKKLKPGELRELLMRLFFLKLTKSEVGAVITKYGDRNGDVDLHPFLREFVTMGIHGRAQDAAEQRRLNDLAEKRAEEEQRKKLEEKAKKSDMVIDYDFSVLDEARATEKLKDAAMKYDRTSSTAQSLSGFECEFLMPGAFRDLLRRTFNLNFSNKEIGFIVRKYDPQDKGKVVCAPFVSDFIRLGVDERYKRHMAQLDKQKKADMAASVEMEKKIAAQTQEVAAKISYEFSDEDQQNALAKLSKAATKYDRARGNKLESFQAASLTPSEFRDAIAKTFNLVLPSKELGALIDYIDNTNTGNVNCHKFLTEFFNLGAKERFKHRSEQLKAQREAEQKAREEHEAKIKANMTKSTVPIDFSFTDEDRDTALSKMTVAAAKYDANHPSSMKLTYFEVKHMDAGQFREAARQTFNLKLTPKEVGALLKHFSKDGDDTLLDSGEFIKFFLQLGIAERHRLHKVMLDRQRADDREREADLKRKLEAQENRVDIQPATGWTKDDERNILEKLHRAAEGFDKNHPAAPPLDAFDAAFMTAGQLSQSLRVLFGIMITPKELGYIVSLYDNDGDGRVDCHRFIKKFLADGKKRRFERQKAFLDKQREAERLMNEKEEERKKALWAGKEFVFDATECTSDDRFAALDKMGEAAEKYDKNHTTAPSLDAFTGGAMKPGAFLDATRKTFNLNFSPRELLAILKEFPMSTDPSAIDSKAFLVKFVKMGVEARAKARAIRLDQQRQAEKDAQHATERKRRLAEQRNVLTVDNDFAESDFNSAMEKLRVASIKYDKTSPGCPSLEAFNAAFFTPHQFKVVMKQTFGIVYTPKELAAMVAEYDNGEGNVDSGALLVNFIKMGTEERAKIRHVQLEQQRKMEFLRRTEHERKMKELEQKAEVKVKYDFTPEEEDSAFEKLAIAAKKYDKAHPGCMGLEGFEAAEMNATMFREMLKRTFGVVLNAGELGAVMQYFDTNNTGSVQSSEFLTHFIKVGMAERSKEKSRLLRKQRKAEMDRQKEAADKLAAQWALADSSIVFEYSEEDKNRAIEKLTDIARKYDPGNPGPMGLSAFQCTSMTPAVFREMIRRSFQVSLTDSEVAALSDMFKKEGTGTRDIVCAEFLVKFRQLGMTKRSELRLSQLEKSKAAANKMHEDAAARKKAADDKMEGTVDFNFTKDDFNSALEKIRGIVASYDPNHVAAPSLKGFVGANMRAIEFKDMIMRTFAVPLTWKELGSLVKFYDTTGSSTVDTREFLAHFSRLLRADQTSRRKRHIEGTRAVQKKQQDEVQERIKGQQQEEAERLRFGPEDEASFVAKIREAAQDYAVNSLSLMEGLQPLRGPALTPASFRELFYRVFKARLTYPEVGVLLGIIDTNGLGVIDGKTFLNWFFKVSRREEKILLGEAEDNVTIDVLRTGGTAKSLAALEPYNSSSSSKGTKNKKGKEKQSRKSVAGGDAGSESDSDSQETGSPHSLKASKAKGKGKSHKISNHKPEVDVADSEFTSASLSQQWVLPAAAAASTSSRTGTAEGQARASSSSGRDDDNPLKIPTALALSDEYLTKRIAQMEAQERQKEKAFEAKRKQEEKELQRKREKEAAAAAAADAAEGSAADGHQQALNQKASLSKQGPSHTVSNGPSGNNKMVVLTPLSLNKDGVPRGLDHTLTEEEKSSLFSVESPSNKKKAPTASSGNSLTRRLEKMGIGSVRGGTQQSPSRAVGSSNELPRSPETLLTTMFKHENSSVGTGADKDEKANAEDSSQAGNKKNAHAAANVTSSGSVASSVKTPAPFDFMAAFSYDTLSKDDSLFAENDVSSAITGASVAAKGSNVPKLKINKDKTNAAGDGGNNAGGKVQGTKKGPGHIKKPKMHIESQSAPAGGGGANGFLFPTLLSSQAPIVNIAPSGLMELLLGDDAA